MAKAFELDLGGFVLRGKRWGTPGGQPVMALHGWLDNCASFDFLAPLMPQLDLLAIDLPGHGHSDHYNRLGAYNIWQDIPALFAAADQLGWDTFGLLGHSRGAIIAFLAAGTLSGRVTHLGLLDGILFPGDEAADMPGALAATIETLGQQAGRPRTSYASFEAAVRARARGMFNLCDADATALARHGVEQTAGGGYRWCYDPRLTARSELRLSQAHYSAFAERLAAKTRLLVAEAGVIQQYPQVRDWLARHPAIQQIPVPGDHYCHMQAHCRAVADVLNAELW